MTRERDEMLEPDEQQRIDELKRQVEEQVDGDMLSMEFGVPGASPGLREQFWQSVLAWEKAPWTSQFEQLRKHGLDLPHPDHLDDQTLTTKLWEVVHALAEQRVFLDHTDHLSDRQLYEQLYHEALHEATRDVPVAGNAFATIDMIGGGGEEDVELLARFYADDQERELYRNDFFPDGLPERQKPPFDRDRLLPRAPDEPLIDDQTPTDRRWFEQRE